MDIMKKFWSMVILVAVIAMAAFKESLDLILSGEFLPFIIGFVILVILASVGKFVSDGTNAIDKLQK